MTRRGQLVLLAAAALAVALVPMALAHLQLGYHDDVQSATVDSRPVDDAERTLHRALDGAARGIPQQYPWTDRHSAVTAVRDQLRPTLATLNTSRLGSGTVYGISYNDSRAQSWMQANCPSGPDRQFGSCRTDRGVVVQERASETHVLAVAVDIRVTTDDSDWHAVTVLTVNSPTV